MTTVPCKVESCDDRAAARGWCRHHYARWRRGGDPLTPLRRKPERLCSIEGCTNTARTRDWCPTHYDRWFRTGSTELPPRPTPIERYWSYVDTSGGPEACWPWTGVRTKRGYGMFTTGNVRHLATRWGYRNRIGPIPDGHGILHHCDNPPCQNDRHWFTGTQADNIADMIRKGRQNRSRRKRTA